MKFREYITEKKWKKLSSNKFHYEFDKTKDLLARQLSGNEWEVRFMEELSPGEPPAPMKIMRGKSKEGVMRAAVTDVMKNGADAWKYGKGIIKVNEGKSDKPYLTLQNMVAIVRKPEDYENTLDIINKAEQKKHILPVQATRLRKELDMIRSSM
jgi:hypothetical protein